MKGYAVLGFIPIALVCGSCALRPPLPSEHRVSVGEVIERVQCELAEAVRPHLARHEWLNDMAAGYVLTLKVEDEGSVAPSADIIDLLAKGTFTLSLAGAATHTANRTASMDFSVNVDDLANYDCDSGRLHDFPVRYFSDGTGLKDWLDRIVAGIDRDDKDRVQQPEKFGHTLEFGIKLTAGVTPSWVFVHAKPKVAVAASRKDNHSLAVGFVKRVRPSAPKPIDVFVTNFPKWMQKPSATEELEGSRKSAERRDRDERTGPTKRRGKKDRSPRGKRGFTPVDPFTQDRLDRYLYQQEQRGNPLLQRQ
jgi:hypothetical protein